MPPLTMTYLEFKYNAWAGKKENLGAAQQELIKRAKVRRRFEAC